MIMYFLDIAQWRTRPTGAREKLMDGEGPNQVLFAVDNFLLQILS